MKHSQTYSHRYGLEATKKHNLFNEIIGLLHAPNVGVRPGAAPQINKHVKNALTQGGWALSPPVHTAFNITINAMKGRVGLTTQTGNTARAFYDLLKFQYLHMSNRIDVGVLLLPTIDAAKTLGHNVANFTRVTNELELYTHVVTVPCLILSFD
jgi:hypothetical protein